MVDDVTIKSEDVDNLVRAIRTHADAKALRRELARGLNSATKDLRRQMVDAIPEALPRRGGLAERMREQVTSSASAKSGKYAGVSIRFRSKGYDMRTLTGGRIRHPLFGNRLHWFDQTAGVDGDAFGDEFDDRRPEITRAVVRVLDDVARKVTNI